jgi:hypothetical protein
MRNTRLFFYLLVKTLCSLSGIALLKLQLTPVVAGVRLSTLPLMLLYQTIHRRVFRSRIHNFVTLIVPVSFLAATFVSVHVMVLLHASVAIYQEILVARRCKILVSVEHWLKTMSVTAGHQWHR